MWDYIDAGTVQENIPRAIIRNGKVYLPAASVCKYFGLGTYYVQNDDTLGYPLFRIKNENEGLDDKTFVSSARAVLLDRLKTFYNSQVSQSAEPSQDLPVPRIIPASRERGTGPQRRADLSGRPVRHRRGRGRGTGCPKERGAVGAAAV